MNSVQKLQECSDLEKPSKFISCKNEASVQTAGTKATKLMAGVIKLMATTGMNKIRMTNSLKH